MRHSRENDETAKKNCFGDKMLNNLDTHFFQKSGLITFLHLEQVNLLQKKSEKTDGRKYEKYL